MTVDYDTPRRTQADTAEDSLEQLAGRRIEVPAASLDVDDADPVDSYDLPDAELSVDDLMVQVVPRQPDEFTCSSCFLVHHRSRLAHGTNGHSVCTECV